jgi:hypothetical protein
MHLDDQSIAYSPPDPFVQHANVPITNCRQDHQPGGEVVQVEGEPGAALGRQIDDTLDSHFRVGQSLADRERQIGQGDQPLLGEGTLC